MYRFGRFLITMVGTYVALLAVANGHLLTGYALGGAVVANYQLIVHELYDVINKVKVGPEEIAERISYLKDCMETIIHSEILDKVEASLRDRGIFDEVQDEVVNAMGKSERGARNADEAREAIKKWSTKS